MREADLTEKEWIKTGWLKKERLPEFVCMLDRSRSMYGKERRVIESYNRWIGEQKRLHGNLPVTTVLFHTECQFLSLRTPVKYLGPMDSFTYYVQGDTACFDAVEEVLELLLKEERQRKPEYRTPAVFLLFTDGMDNASIRSSEDKIKQILASRKDWTFLLRGEEPEEAFREAGIILRTYSRN